MLDAIDEQAGLERPTPIQKKMKAELQDFAQAVRQKRQPPVTVIRRSPFLNR
jgi:hypothetical protein